MHDTKQLKDNVWLKLGKQFNTNLINNFTTFIKICFFKEDSDGISFISFDLLNSTVFQLGLNALYSIFNAKCCCEAVAVVFFFVFF